MAPSQADRPATHCAMCGRCVEYHHRSAWALPLCFECLPPCTTDEVSFAQRLAREGPMKEPPKFIDGSDEVE